MAPIIRAEVEEIKIILATLFKIEQIAQQMTKTREVATGRRIYANCVAIQTNMNHLGSALSRYHPPKDEIGLVLKELRLILQNVEGMIKSGSDVRNGKYIYEYCKTILIFLVKLENTLATQYPIKKEAGSLLKHTMSVLERFVPR